MFLIDMFLRFISWFDVDIPEKFSKVWNAAISYEKI